MLHYDEIYKKLLEDVVGQDEAVRQVSLAVYKYLLKIQSEIEFNHVINSNINVLMYGPTGNGKTYIIDRLCHIVDLPVVVINSKSIAQEGWSGHSFIDLLVDGLIMVSGTKSFPERAVIVVDEFDKMVVPNISSSGKDASIVLQHSILKYVEGHKTIAHGRILDTGKLLFMFTGAFNDLIPKQKNEIGYHNTDHSKVDLNKAFEDYGMIPEMLGRVGTIVALNKLDLDSYLEILSRPNFPFNSWLKFFDLATANKELSIDKYYLAEQAVKDDLGVRGLIRSCERHVDELVLKNQEYFRYRYQTAYKFLPDNSEDE